MMRRTSVRVLICLIVLALVGHFRMQYEENAAQNLREASLLEPQIDASTREKLGQRAAFFALGGLRTIMATWRSFVAFDHFQNARWVELEQEYDLITTLSPHSEYHWATGGWHLAYNASGYFERQNGMLPIQRRRLSKAYVRRGREFFKDGIRYNPESWRLKAKLATLYADAERYPDYSQAADWFLKVSESDDAMDFYRRAAVYALAREPTRRSEAYERLVELWKKEENRVPMIQSLMFVLQEHLGITGNRKLDMKSIFGTPRDAYHHLSNYYRRGDVFPKDKVLESLEALEKSLKIPPEKSRIRRMAPKTE